jgi:uncharacterized protein
MAAGAGAMAGQTAVGAMAAGETAAGATVGTMGGGTGKETTMARATQIETVVIQPTPFCNINCAYCYLPGRNQNHLITLGTIIACFERVFDSGFAAPSITVIWHAGEPLVAPIDLYRRAFPAIAEICPAEVHVRHSLQTNGILINEAWCDLFREWDVGVGVSIDGPEALHDTHRRSRSGGGTFDRTIRGVRMLRKAAVPFHVITVVTAETLARSPQELLDFYESEGIEDVCFNVEESEGDHGSALFQRSGFSRDFARFLEEFWLRARQSGKIRFLREIDGMLPRIFRSDQGPICNPQTEPFAMLNVDHEGNVSSFSPELLGYRNETYRDFIVGNVHSHSLSEMRQSATMIAMARDIAAGVELCRRECDYFSVCGGGAPVNKLTENGGFRSGTTAFCTLTQKIPTDIILSAFSKLQAGASASELRLYSQRSGDRRREPI